MTQRTKSVIAMQFFLWRRFPNRKTPEMLSRSADLEICDTADLEVCATSANSRAITPVRGLLKQSKIENRESDLPANHTNLRESSENSPAL